MSYYDTLHVVPWADDAVIRSAYRALMRIYHPDTNADPEAQQRAREITRAFAVLGDPEKRAAYDALPRLGDRMESPDAAPFPWDRRLHPQIRKWGIASAAIVLAVGLTVAMWPRSGPGSSREVQRGAPTHASAGHVSARTDVPAAPRTVGAPVKDTAPVSASSDTEAMPSQQTHAAILSQPKGPALPEPKREIAQVAAPKAAPPSKPIAAERVPAAAPEARPDDHRAQVERLAADSLKQSLEHADWHKHELLLSARNRAVFTRAMCRSNECVTETYLRQIRETNEIMQGRIPNP